MLSGCIAAVAVALALSAPASAGEGCGASYEVAPGDTLSRIAARCGTSVEALMRANPRITHPERIAVGWRLDIPGAHAAQAEPAGGKSLDVTGRIVNGRRCALIETADGTEYGIVSPELAFVNGDLVEVTGQIVDDPSCKGPRTLRVDELTEAQPT